MLRRREEREADYCITAATGEVFMFIVALGLVWSGLVWLRGEGQVEDLFLGELGRVVVRGVAVMGFRFRFVWVRDTCTSSSQLTQN